MKNGKIPDENIAASSWQEPFHAFRPEAGRLDNEDGVWCPNTLGEKDKEYYLQVEFPSRYNICAVATQGSPLYDTDWVKKYRIEFSMDGKNFTSYAENRTVKVQYEEICTRFGPSKRPPLVADLPNMKPLEIELFPLGRNRIPFQR